jgi:hypothetical protein
MELRPIKKKNATVPVGLYMPTISIEIRAVVVL